MYDGLLKKILMKLVINRFKIFLGTGIEPAGHSTPVQLDTKLFPVFLLTIEWLTVDTFLIHDKSNRRSGGSAVTN
jgi:hypothetical protein